MERSEIWKNHCSPSPHLSLRKLFLHVVIIVINIIVFIIVIIVNVTIIAIIIKIL